MSNEQIPGALSPQVATIAAASEHQINGSTILSASGTETRTLVTVPNVEAIHVLGESSITISTGDLILLSSPTSSAAGADPTSTSESVIAATEATATTSPPADSPSKLKHITQPVLSHIGDQHDSSQSSHDDKAVVHLTLAVGTQAAFPLYPTTLFGTIVGDTRVYLFAPEFGGRDHVRNGGGQGGYIKLIFPDAVNAEGSEESKAQEQFEKVLVEKGLLKAGAGAFGDELGGVIRDDAIALAAWIQGHASNHVKSTDPTSSPHEISQNTHKAIESSSHYTGSAREWTKAASDTIMSATHSAGAWIANKIGSANALGDDLRTVRTTKVTAVETLSSAGDGVNDAASSLSNALSNATHAVITHEYGEDTANALRGVAQTTRNVRGMGADVVKSTSGVSHMVSAAVGFASVPTPSNDSTAAVGDSRSETEAGTSAMSPPLQPSEPSTASSSHNMSGVDVTEMSSEMVKAPLETIPL